MKFNNKKLGRVSKLINYIIAIVLCGFLISLSGKLIDDVDEWKERPIVEQFENEALIISKNSEIEKINEELEIKRKKRKH